MCQVRSPTHRHQEHAMTRLGYQIPNYTYPNTANEDIFASVVA